MGMPQFIPSSYLDLAVDGDGDGRCDLWHSDADVFASVAHYFAEHGWTRVDALNLPFVLLGYKQIGKSFAIATMMTGMFAGFVAALSVSLRCQLESISSAASIILDGAHTTLFARPRVT